MTIDQCIPPLIQNMFNGARILVAPLAWGLGHATRCVPIIRRLIDHGAQPIIGGDGAPLQLLRHEFPELETARIPGIEIRYSGGRTQAWGMTRQFPGMMRSVVSEKLLFDRLRRAHRLDAVISDQRFGLRSMDLPSILITHQLFPFTPMAGKALRRLNRWLIERFDRCWVMDIAEAPGSAGDLSHGTTLPSNVTYIGTHSRMRWMPRSDHPEHGVLALLSGPEPQRTMFEEILESKLKEIPGQHLLVRGLPGQQGTEREGPLTKVSHLGPEDLAAAISKAGTIVARSGYSTLMDLIALQRTALIVPTPGQLEQEYLARLHSATGRFIAQDQQAIDLVTAIEQCARITIPAHTPGTPLLDGAMTDMAHLLR